MQWCCEVFRDRRETRSGCFTGSKDTGDALADLRPIGISVKFKLDSTKGGGEYGMVDAAFYKTLVGVIVVVMVVVVVVLVVLWLWKRGL